MKNIIMIAVLSVTALTIKGCYTQIASADNDTIIIYYPDPPEPCCPDPVPPPPPPTHDPPPQKEKIRKHEPPPTSNKDEVRDRTRNTGGRNISGKRNKR
ncbi:MAG: hypothetical protein PVF17_07340 [Ignavibacteria bacterium]|jgi:hypothetical protein